VIDLDFSVLIWAFFIMSMLMPALKQKQIEATRLKVMHDLQRKRRSRVITLIHRQEALSILGFTFSRYINIEDSEQVLRAIRTTPSNVPIDLILHTPGGLVLASEQIARALVRHEATVTVFVPHYAMSGGTLIALAANQIVLDPNAVLGPVDPQIGQYPAASILKVLESKEPKDIDDDTMILADIARKAISQVKRTVSEIVVEKMDADAARELAEQLASGQWTHDYPLTCPELTQMGLAVCDEMPEEIYKLMDLYPQPAQRRPSVQYIPLPHQEHRSTKS